MPHPIAFGIHMDALYTSPPKFPDDNVRLLFSCMVCEALDQTTIRMNYAFGEAEVNCFCCGTQWKMKATRKSRDTSTQTGRGRGERRGANQRQSRPSKSRSTSSGRGRSATRRRVVERCWLAGAACFVRTAAVSMMMSRPGHVGGGLSGSRRDGGTRCGPAILRRPCGLRKVGCCCSFLTVSYHTAWTYYELFGSF